MFTMMMMILRVCIGGACVDTADVVVGGRSAADRSRRTAW